MADLDFHIPEFTIALRGYDRFQVDSYIDRLQGLLEETEERLRSLEPGDHHQDVGPRISQIFDLAAAEAQDIRASAEEESTRLLRAARDDAEAVVAAKRSEWEEMLASFEGRREQIRQEVAELRGQKATVIEEVRRLHQALGAASGVAASPAELGVGEPDGPEGQAQLLSPGRAWDREQADGGYADEAIDGDFSEDETFVQEPGAGVSFDEDPPTERVDRTQEFTTVELPEDRRRAG